jgi:uncharacterized protein (TIGR04255 family)
MPYRGNLLELHPSASREVSSTGRAKHSPCSVAQPIDPQGDAPDAKRNHPATPEDDPVNRPFTTPLFEAIVEMHFDPAPPVELPARSLFEALRDEYPIESRLPVVLIPDAQQAVNLFAPAYRFYSPDLSFIVQIGPRMIAVNTVASRVKWQGWGKFRDSSERVFRQYSDLNANARVIRLQLSFFNRIPASSLEEVRSFFNFALPGPSDTLPSDYSFQFTFPSRAGSVVRQFALMPPDATTPVPFLAVNTIIQRPVDGPVFRTALDDWRGWVEIAHETSKDTFYNSLSDEARKSWDESAAASQQTA